MKNNNRLQTNEQSTRNIKMQYKLDPNMNMTPQNVSNLDNSNMDSML